MGKEKGKLSALLITYNEEHNIGEVLDNLSFCDELIVVDSFSTDGTIKLIKEFGKATLIQREFKNYTDQKQFALDQASFDWVLFIDADERITDALKGEILQVVQSDAPTASAYYFLRTFMFKNKRLKYSGWQTDKNYRLFKKSKVHFQSNKIVHETLVVNGPSATLAHKLLHYSYQGYGDYKSKMVKYGKMRAQEEFKKGKRANWVNLRLRPLWKFLNHFFLRLGFLDGKKGIIICYLNALGVLSRYRELKRLETGQSLKKVP